MNEPLLDPDRPGDREMYSDFMFETDAGVATWLLGVLSNLKPITGDELIFQKAVDMLRRISDVDSIDPALLDIAGEGRARATAENDPLTEAYVRAFENGQCITGLSPELSAFAAGYLLGLRPHGLVGRRGKVDGDNIVHGVTVDMCLSEAGYTPRGDATWGTWDGQVNDDDFADPNNADSFRQGVKAARDAADTYLALRSLTDD